MVILRSEGLLDPHSLCFTKIKFMRLLLKSLIISLTLLVTSVSNTMPNYDTNSILNYIISEKSNIKELRENLNISIENRKDIYNYPIGLPMIDSTIKAITSPFGYRIHPIYHVRMFHKGIDISAKPNTIIYSTGNGIVKSVKTTCGYGKQIIIEHNNGYISMYAHLNSYLVNPNDTVKIGDPIGLVGSTGLSTGSHLHYEIRLNNIPINPLSIYSDTLSKDTYISYLSQLNKDLNCSNNV